MLSFQKDICNVQTEGVEYAVIGSTSDKFCQNLYSSWKLLKSFHYENFVHLIASSLIKSQVIWIMYSVFSLNSAYRKQILLMKTVLNEMRDD